MAMIVRNNAVANRTLSNLDKSDKARTKSAAKLSSGMKINSAADDASSLAISERMRVKLRALDQDSQNVQNGAAILNTAEGGIQGQIDLIRTIKAKVIDAANDHNTEEDRQTIQKELSHLYTQIENLAYDTDYNSKKPLIGDVPFDKAKWSSTAGGGANMPKDIDIDVIANNYAELDDITGPFDTFTEYSAATVSREKMSNGVDNTPKIMTADFSSYRNVADLDNVCVVVQGRYNNRSYTNRFVLTSDTSRNYLSYPSKVPLGNTVSDTLNNLANSIKRYATGVSDATVDGLKVKVTTYDKGTAANAANIYGAQDAGGTVTEYSSYRGKGAGVSGSTSGGRNDPVAADSDTVPGAKAKLTLNLSDVESDSGFMFNGYSFRVVDADETIQRTGVNITLTKGQPASGGIHQFRYSFNGNDITFEANENGAQFNNYNVNGTRYYYSEPVQNNYDAYTAFNGTVETVQEGADTGSNPYWTMDLSGMTVNDFSQKYSGKYLEVSAYDAKDVLRYKFYDSSLAPSINGFPEDAGSRESNKATKQIDINEIRKAVQGGKTLAQAVNDTLAAPANRLEVDGDKVKILSTRVGKVGENDTVTIQNETMRHYDIDFAQLEGTVTIPDDLYGKGFRAYCATDNREWFNFVFTDGKVSYKSEQDNVKNYNINVSEVTNAAELARAIYDQATPLLEGSDQKFNHHFRLAVDNATLTIYDHRRFDVRNYTDAEGNSVYQERGAKIADGVNLEDSEPEPVEDDSKEKVFYAKDLVIQHTDKANMNIHIKIPQMTLDHIFDPLPVDPSTIFDYPVTDKASRNALLGNPNPPGILDNGLQYMLDAVTFVGAQNNRLAHTAQNITTEMENLTASESTIRDADMAREFTEYTKNNILNQAAQAVLAQANQLPSMVLELLG